MDEHRDEAEFLENRADRPEDFIYFSKAQPAVFPNLKASSPRVAPARLRRKPDETEAESGRQEPRE